MVLSWRSPSLWSEFSQLEQEGESKIKVEVEAKSKDVEGGCGRVDW